MEKTINIISLKKTGSTNDEARRMAKAGVSEWTVIRSEEQSHGRGRLGRKWESPAGGLWFSVVLRPGVVSEKLTGLTSLIAEAVSEGITRTTGLATEIKLPNDILINGRKVSGILVESQTGKKGNNYVIAGVGINANFALAQMPEDLREKVTTLETHLKAKVNLELLLDTIVEIMQVKYEDFLNDHAE